MFRVLWIFESVLFIVLAFIGAEGNWMGWFGVALWIGIIIMGFKLNKVNLLRFINPFINEKSLNDLSKRKRQIISGIMLMILCIMAGVSGIFIG